jgi:hypothetical protein
MFIYLITLNIVRVIKLRRMRWVRHVACMEEERGVHRILIGRITLRWIFGR